MNNYLSNLVMPFGKYAGRRIDEIPYDYARWAAANMSAINDEQRAALAARGKKAAPAASRDVEVVDLPGVAEIFRSARAKLKWPKVTFSDPVVFRLLAIPDGRIMVTNGKPKFDGRIVYGMISPEGRAEINRTCPPSVVAKLKRLSEDPASVAAEHGHHNGSCCFCGLELTDPRSVEVGYGPVCAKNYGLPH